MEQFIVLGYVPFTHLQISFDSLAVCLAAMTAGWFYLSLRRALAQAERHLPLTQQN